MQTTVQLPGGVPGWAEKGALQAEEAPALIPKLGTFLVFRGSGAGLDQTEATWQGKRLTGRRTGPDCVALYKRHRSLDFIFLASSQTSSAARSRGQSGFIETRHFLEVS